MTSTRRNALIGLGGLAIGGGALFATGAFTQVEAERTISVETVGDDVALLQFQVDTSYAGIDDTGGDVFAIDFQNLNIDAVSAFDDVLEIGNSGSNEIEITIEGHGLDEGLVFYEGAFPGSDTISGSEYGDDGTITAGETIGDGGTLELGLAVNTNPSNPGDFTDHLTDTDTVTITIIAAATD